MALAQIYRQHLAIYHASLGWTPEFWLGMNKPQVWVLMTQSLQQLKLFDLGLEVHAFVLMNTHAHLLYSCRRGLEQYAMEELNKTIYKKKFEDISTLYKNLAELGLERPFFIELVGSFRQLLNTHKYIYRNPIEAGLVLRVEEYRYSTLCELLGRQSSSLTVVDILHVVQDPRRILNWLNQSISVELYSRTHTH